MQALIYSLLWSSFSIKLDEKNLVNALLLTFGINCIISNIMNLIFFVIINLKFKFQLAIIHLILFYSILF